MASSKDRGRRRDLDFRISPTQWLIVFVLWAILSSIMLFLGIHIGKSLRMGEKGKCTFGTRMPIDTDHLNEIIYREVKHFRNYRIYTPNFGSLPLTGKFYAAHDRLLSETPEESQKVDRYRLKVAQTRAMGPRGKYPYAATVNQEYGWYSKPLMPMNRSDRRFYKPHVDSHHTKVEVIIAMSNPKNRV